VATSQVGAVATKRAGLTSIGFCLSSQPLGIGNWGLLLRAWIAMELLEALFD